jgi:hypothetical protein
MITMLPFSVVEHLDVLETGGLHVSLGRVLDALHPLVLEAVEPAVGVLSQQLPFRLIEQVMPYSWSLAWKAWRILAAPVGGVQQSRRRPLPEPGHGQRIGHDIRGHAWLQGLAHDLAVEPVENDGQIQPAFVRPQIREAHYAFRTATSEGRSAGVLASLCPGFWHCARIERSPGRAEASPVKCRGEDAAKSAGGDWFFSWLAQCEMPR